MRQKAVTAIKNAFGSEMKEIYQGFISGIENIGDMQFPCMWLTPLEVAKKATGKEEATYKVMLYYFESRDSYTEESKEEIWSQQEAMAIKGFESLCDSPDISYAETLVCEPNEFALTPSRAIAMKVTFLMHTPCCAG